MDHPFFVAVVGAIGLIAAAVLAVANLRRRSRPLGLAWRILACCAVTLNVEYVIFLLIRHGLIETFRHDFEAAILLATLLGAVGLATSVVRSLRGLDAMLLLTAGLIDLAALRVMNVTAGQAEYHRWFVSHGLAFSVSVVCWLGSGIAGVAYLIVYRYLRQKRHLGLIGSIPSLEALERFGRWTLVLGFPVFTYGMLTGMCGLAHPGTDSRQVWAVDPTVWLSFLVWGGYGSALLILLVMPELRGRKAAVLASLGMVLVMITWVSREFSAIHQ